MMKQMIGPILVKIYRYLEWSNDKSYSLFLECDSFAYVFI